MTALENVELPTDALPVDAVLRRAAASHHRTSIGQQPRSVSAGRADKRPGCVYIVVCVCDVMVASEKRMKEEDIRNTLLMKKALAAQCEDMEEEGRTSGRDVGEARREEAYAVIDDSSVLFCARTVDNDHVAFCSVGRGRDGVPQPPTDAIHIIKATVHLANLHLGCPAQLSPLTDLASIVAEVDANEVFMLHKTNMLEEIGAENELMERSCRNDGLIGMGGLPGWTRKKKRGGRRQRREEEERLREERKEQELNKVAEETNEQEKRAKEATPNFDEHPSHIPLHYPRTCLLPAPSQLTPLLHQRWGNEELLMIRSDVQATHNEDNRDELDQYSYSLLETMSDAGGCVGNKEKRKELDELWE
ncbi:hypothetical protein BLNAU_21587 [Blattamonas nauphoetae]|uniref:Uncharacterized protein n=1 Tax=Blattamonas nauphoetae TaxID=2049346 RepID=A0ABQ9WW10_9EUKA|nr:hypothetical protein BLNAU_21587 [Blattamonas nauphoetae]